MQPPAIYAGVVTARPFLSTPCMLPSYFSALSFRLASLFSLCARDKYAVALSHDPLRENINIIRSDPNEMKRKSVGVFTEKCGKSGVVADGMAFLLW